MYSNDFDAMLRRIEQAERELERKYVMLPVSKRIIELVDHYEGLERANATNGNFLVSDGHGGSTTLRSANRQYLAAIPLLLEKNERLLNIDTAVPEILAGIEEEEYQDELERFESLLETANSLVEMQAYEDTRLTGKEFGNKVLPFLERIAQQLHRQWIDEATESVSASTKLLPHDSFPLPESHEMTDSITEPLILSYLRSDTRLQVFREFIANQECITTTEEGVLIWPCEIAEGKLKPLPGKRWATQQGLAWIIEQLFGHTSICGLDEDRFTHAAAWFTYVNAPINPKKLQRSANAIRNDPTKNPHGRLKELTGLD